MHHSLWLQILLTPFSWLYGFAVLVRNMLYDNHILPSISVNVPTICVGNLAVGGTGKTPHVEYLVNLLQVHYKVAVLSRGYGRHSRGFVVADEHSTVDTIGDELLQMYHKYPDIHIVACENRVRGIKQLMNLFPDTQVVVLDDAFQHRSLCCGYSILLTAYDNMYIQDHLLPAGSLREGAYAAMRANMVLVTKCPDKMLPIDKRIVDNSLHLPAFQPLIFSWLKYAPGNINSTPLIVTGIANPHYLLEYLQIQYPQAKLMAFPDHHRYTKWDITAIEKMACQYEVVVTTEKDWTRLSTCQLSGSLLEKIQVLPVQVDLREHQEEFNRNVLRYVTETIRKNSQVKQ